MCESCVDGLDAETCPEGFGDVPQPFPIRPAQHVLQRFLRLRRVPLRLGEDRLQAIPTDLQGPHSLQQGLFEGAADGHHFAHRFHLGGEGLIGLWEFFEGEARDFDHAVIDRGLERGWRLVGDVVGDLIEGIADRQLGGDPGDGEASGLGGQGRAARYARVHLDDHHAAILGVDRELDVGAAGLDADLANNLGGRIAHALIFFVRQRLGRGHGNAVAGMHAHGVEIFDRADDHHIVAQIAHDLQLEFFPAEHRLFDENFVVWTGAQSPLHVLGELLLVIGDVPTRAAQREGGANDHRKALGC